LAAFLQGLQQLGWTDGRNVRIDTRWGALNADLMRKYAEGTWSRSSRTLSWLLVYRAGEPLWQLRVHRAWFVWRPNFDVISGRGLRLRNVSST
jgi:hypothetical protein